jgi:hypothetical protein
VRVGAGSLASSDTARTETLLALRTRYRGAASKPMHEHPLFWALLVLAPLPAVILSTRERRRRTAERSPNRQARLAKLAKDESLARDACEVRRAYTMALAERLGLDPESFTRPGALARSLRRRGVSTDLALEAERFLRQLDEAAFSATGTLADDAARNASDLYRKVDQEALPSARIAVATLVIVGLVAAGVATAHAYDASEARRTFDEGVAAYQRHDFVAARESFIASVAADPRAPDAWADLGTASWAAADTARSMAAWQRALRMEPLADDVRDRVELVHALPWSASGWVPALPAAWIFDLAALLWLVAWTTSAWRASRGRPIASRDIATVGVIAGALLIVGFALSERLNGRHLAAMRRTASLNNEPQLGGELGATAIIGEVVRVTGRQGAWSRIVLDDGRDGWIETAALISIDATDVDQIRID